MIPANKKTFPLINLEIIFEYEYILSYIVLFQNVHIQLESSIHRINL